MSFDARSRERLEALGRQLPKPLPLPEPARNQARPDAPRHAVETEQDPDQLFRELMAASADGHVPLHWMDRLRELEESRRRQARGPVPPGPGAPASANANQTSPLASGNRAETAAARRSTRPRNRRPGNARPQNSEEEALYTAFQQLLLEDDEILD